MKTEGRWERHPLCTCPELTLDAATGRAEPPDLAACRKRAGVVDPHPVLTEAEMRKAIADLRARLTAPYRPGDL